MEDMEGSTHNTLNSLSASNGAQINGETALKSKPAKGKRLQQVVQSLILYFSFFSMGLNCSIIGPTLLDLQRKTNTSTDTISFMFTARSVVGLVGAVLAGLIVDRINHWVLLGIAMAIMGPLHILIPYMDNFWSLLAVFSLPGGTISFLIAGANMVLLKIWGEKNGPWLQALHFMFGPGSLIGPLLAEPFLRSREDATPTVNPNVVIGYSTDVYWESSAVSNSATLKAVKNVSLAPLGDNMTRPFSGDEYESKVHWAYLIVGLTAILSSTLFLGTAIFCSEIQLQCLNRMRKSKINSEKKGISDESEDRTFRLQILFTVFLFYFFYSLMEVNYGNYLTAFAVRGLGWSEKEGARVTSAYWATFTAGRGLGIILVKFLPPWLMMTGDLSISVVSLVVLTLFSHYHHSVLWVCTLTLGFGISTIYATGITWTEQCICITGVAGAVFMIAGAGGVTIGPILIGTLFTVIGPKSFLFVMCSAICLLAVLFAVMQVLRRRHIKKKCSEQIAESTALHQEDPNEGITEL